MHSSANVEVLDAERPEDARRWNALVEASPFVDVGFRPGFVRANQVFAEESSLALLVTVGVRRFLVPLQFRRVPEHDVSDARTASNLGGILPLDGLPLDTSTASGLVAAIAEWSRRERVVALFVALHPGLDQREVFDAPAVREAGGFRLDRPTQVQGGIELGEWDEGNDAIPRIKWERRRDLKRARSELRLEWMPKPARVGADGLTDELRILFELYRQSMDRLQTHEHWRFSESSFRLLLQEIPDQLHVGVAWQGPTPVGAFTVLIDRRFAHGHLTGATEAGRRLGFATLMYVECARRARALGCRALYIGSGMGPDDSVWHFKASFRPVELPDSVLVIAPDRERYETARLASGDSPQAYPPLEMTARTPSPDLPGT